MELIMIGDENNRKFIKLSFVGLDKNSISINKPRDPTAINAAYLDDNNNAKENPVIKA